MVSTIEKAFHNRGHATRNFTQPVWIWQRLEHFGVFLFELWRDCFFLGRVAINGSGIQHPGLLLYGQFFKTRTFFFAGVVETIQMKTLRGQRASLFIPGTAVLVCIFETFQATLRSSMTASPFIPGTAILVGVSETIQMTSLSSSCASPFIPRTSVLVKVFETIQMAITGGPSTIIVAPPAFMDRHFFFFFGNGDAFLGWVSINGIVVFAEPRFSQ